MAGTKLCPDCGGTGWSPDQPGVKCPTCNGLGQIPLEVAPTEYYQKAFDSNKLSPVPNSKIDVGGCFGWVNGRFYFANKHHAVIMAHLIDGGMNWEQLAAAPQLWGWYHLGRDYDYENNRYFPDLKWKIDCFSDSGRIDKHLGDEMKAQWESQFAKPGQEVSVTVNGNRQVDDPDAYGQRAKDYYFSGPQPTSSWRLADDQEQLFDPADYEFKSPQIKEKYKEYVENNSEVSDTPKDYPGSGCFGWLDGTFYFGRGHHALIMAYLVSQGWTWDKLIETPQLWGWYWWADKNNPNENYAVEYSYVPDRHIIQVKAYSDSGRIDKDLAERMMAEWEASYPDKPAVLININEGRSVNDPDAYGQRSKDMYFESAEVNPINQTYQDAYNTISVTNTPSESFDDWGCFGWLNGKFYFGKKHHALIMAKLIEDGWDWEDLMNAKQAWGWYGLIPGKGRGPYDYATNTYGDLPDHYDIRVFSDTGSVDFDLIEEMIEQWDNEFKYPARLTYKDETRTQEGDQYGQRAKEYYFRPTSAMRSVYVETPGKDTAGLPFIFVPDIDTLFIATTETFHATLIQSVEDQYGPKVGNEIKEAYGYSGTVGYIDPKNGKPTFYYGEDPQVIAEIRDIFKHSAERDYYKEDLDNPDTDVTNKPPEDGESVPFAWINGVFYFGQNHHALIMAKLVRDGWTWDQLEKARQVWGWWRKIEEMGEIEIWVYSDAARIDRQNLDEMKDQIEKMTGLSVRTYGNSEGEGGDYGQYSRELYGTQKIALRAKVEWVGKPENDERYSFIYDPVKNVIYVHSGYANHYYILGWVADHESAATLKRIQNIYQVRDGDDAGMQGAAGYVVKSYDPNAPLSIKWYAGEKWEQQFAPVLFAAIRQVEADTWEEPEEPTTPPGIYWVEEPWYTDTYSFIYVASDNTIYVHPEYANHYNIIGYAGEQSNEFYREVENIYSYKKAQYGAAGYAGRGTNTFSYRYYVGQEEWSKLIEPVLTPELLKIPSDSRNPYDEEEDYWDHEDDDDLGHYGSFDDALHGYQFQHPENTQDRVKWLTPKPSGQPKWLYNPETDRIWLWDGAQGMGLHHYQAWQDLPEHEQSQRMVMGIGGDMASMHISQASGADDHSRAFQAFNDAMGNPFKTSNEFGQGQRMNERWLEHSQAIPYVYNNGKAYVGRLGQDHFDLMETYPQFNDDRGDTAWRDLEYYGRYFPDGEYVDWRDIDTPQRVKDAVMAEMVRTNRLPKTAAIYHFDYEFDNASYQDWEDQRVPLLADDQNIYVGMGGGHHYHLMSEMDNVIDENHPLYEDPDSWDDPDYEEKIGQLQYWGNIVYHADPYGDLPQAGIYWWQSNTPDNIVHESRQLDPQLPVYRSKDYKGNWERVAAEANPRMEERDDEHYDALPFIWIEGHTYFGSPDGGHYELIQEHPDLWVALEKLQLNDWYAGQHDADEEDEDEDGAYFNEYNPIEGRYYTGRLSPDGEVVPWTMHDEGEGDIPRQVAEQVREDAFKKGLMRTSAAPVNSQGESSWIYDVDKDQLYAWPFLKFQHFNVAATLGIVNDQWWGGYLDVAGEVAIGYEPEDSGFDWASDPVPPWLDKLVKERLAHNDYLLMNTDDQGLKPMQPTAGSIPYHWRWVYHYPSGRVNVAPYTAQSGDKLHYELLDELQPDSNLWDDDFRYGYASEGRVMDHAWDEVKDPRVVDAVRGAINSSRTADNMMRWTPMMDPLKTLQRRIRQEQWQKAIQNIIDSGQTNDPAEAEEILRQQMRYQLDHESAIENGAWIYDPQSKKLMVGAQHYFIIKRHGLLEQYERGGYEQWVYGWFDYGKAVIAPESENDPRQYEALEAAQEYSDANDHVYAKTAEFEGKYRWIYYPEGDRLVAWNDPLIFHYDVSPDDDNWFGGYGNYNGKPISIAYLPTGTEPSGFAGWDTEYKHIIDRVRSGVENGIYEAPDIQTAKWSGTIDKLEYYFGNNPHFTIIDAGYSFFGEDDIGFMYDAQQDHVYVTTGHHPDIANDQYGHLFEGEAEDGYDDYPGVSYLYHNPQDHLYWGWLYLGYGSINVASGNMDMPSPSPEIKDRIKELFEGALHKQIKVAGIFDGFMRWVYNPNTGETIIDPQFGGGKTHWDLARQIGLGPDDIGKWFGGVITDKKQVQVWYAPPLSYGLPRGLDERLKILQAQAEDGQVHISKTSALRYFDAYKQFRTEQELQDYYKDYEDEDRVPFIVNNDKLYLGDRGWEHYDVYSRRDDELGKDVWETSLLGAYYPEAHAYTLYTYPDADEQTIERVGYLLAQQVGNTMPSQAVGKMGATYRWVYNPENDQILIDPAGVANGQKYWAHYQMAQNIGVQTSGVFDQDHWYGGIVNDEGKANIFGEPNEFATWYHAKDGSTLPADIEQRVRQSIAEPTSKMANYVQRVKVVNVDDDHGGGLPFVLGTNGVLYLGDAEGYHFGMGDPQDESALLYGRVLDDGRVVAYNIYPGNEWPDISDYIEEVREAARPYLDEYRQSGGEPTPIEHSAIGDEVRRKQWYKISLADSSKTSAGTKVVQLPHFDGEDSEGIPFMYNETTDTAYVANRNSHHYNITAWLSENGLLDWNDHWQEGVVDDEGVYWYADEGYGDRPKPPNVDTVAQALLSSIEGQRTSTIQSMGQTSPNPHPTVRLPFQSPDIELDGVPHSFSSIGTPQTPSTPHQTRPYRVPPIHVREHLSKSAGNFQLFGDVSNEDTTPAVSDHPEPQVYRVRDEDSLSSLSAPIKVIPLGTTDDHGDGLPYIVDGNKVYIGTDQGFHYELFKQMYPENIGSAYEIFNAMNEKFPTLPMGRVEDGYFDEYGDPIAPRYKQAILDYLDEKSPAKVSGAGEVIEPTKQYDPRRRTAFLFVQSNPPKLYWGDTHYEIANDLNTALQGHNDYEYGAVQNYIDQYPHVFGHVYPGSVNGVEFYSDLYNWEFDRDKEQDTNPAAKAAMPYLKEVVPSLNVWDKSADPLGHEAGLLARESSAPIVNTGHDPIFDTAWCYKDGTIYLGSNHYNIIQWLEKHGIDPSDHAVFGWGFQVNEQPYAQSYNWESYSDPELKEDALRAVNEALDEIRKQSTDEDRFFRWMLDKRGEVVFTTDDTHYELIDQYWGWDDSDLEEPNSMDYSDSRFITGGYLSDGDLEIVRTDGEPDFDPVQVAAYVGARAQSEGLTVDQVTFKDMTLKYPNFQKPFTEIQSEAGPFKGFMAKVAWGPFNKKKPDPDYDPNIHEIVKKFIPDIHEIDDPDELDENIEYRWAYHQGQLAVWEAATGFHDDWKDKQGIQWDQNLDAAGMFDLKLGIIWEYHAKTDHYGELGPQVLQAWLGRTMEVEDDRPGIANFVGWQPAVPHGTSMDDWESYWQRLEDQAREQGERDSWEVESSEEIDPKWGDNEWRRWIYDADSGKTVVENQPSQTYSHGHLNQQAFGKDVFPQFGGNIDSNNKAYVTYPADMSLLAYYPDVDWDKIKNDLGATFVAGWKPYRLEWEKLAAPKEKKLEQIGTNPDGGPVYYYTPNPDEYEGMNEEDQYTPGPTIKGLTSPKGETYLWHTDPYFEWPHHYDAADALKLFDPKNFDPVGWEEHAFDQDAQYHNHYYDDPWEAKLRQLVLEHRRKTSAREEDKFPDDLTHVLVYAFVWSPTKGLDIDYSTHYQMLENMYDNWEEVEQDGPSVGWVFQDDSGNPYVTFASVEMGSMAKHNQEAVEAIEQQYGQEVTIIKRPGIDNSYEEYYRNPGGYWYSDYEWDEYRDNYYRDQYYRDQERQDSGYAA